MVQYNERSLASVESAAMVVCMLVDHDVIVPLNKLQLDCIDRRWGRMLAKDESEKKTGNEGR